MLGPTMRAELKQAEFNEIALPTSPGPPSRPRRTAARARRARWRARSRCEHRHVPVLHVASVHERAQPSAWPPITDWVTSSSRRLRTRSAIAPDTIEKRRIGPNWSVPIRPSSNGEEVSWSTSQDWATVCIQDPTCATNCAAKKRRKSAWRNARRPVGRAIGGRSAAGHALGIDEDRVERLARGEEEPVALGPAEAEIGAPFGEQDAADQPGVRIVDRDAVEPLAPAPAAPELPAVSQRSRPGCPPRCG